MNKESDGDVKNQGRGEVRGLHAGIIYDFSTAREKSSRNERDEGVPVTVPG